MIVEDPQPMTEVSADWVFVDVVFAGFGVVVEIDSPIDLVEPMREWFPDELHAFVTYLLVHLRMTRDREKVSMLLRDVQKMFVLLEPREI